MNWFIVIITLLTLNKKCEGAVTEDDLIKKCCGYGEYLNVTTKDNFECAEDIKKRLGINTNYSNFLTDHISGSCIDITPDGFFKFLFENKRIIKENPIGNRHFPKCCPMGYNYVTNIHACRENISINEDYIKETYVKVGLPACKLITDEKIREVFLDLDPNDDKYCIDQDENGDFIRRNCQDSIEGVCDKIRCVKKCCGDGKSFVNGAKCVDTYIHGLDLTFSDNIADNLGN